MDHLEFQMDEKNPALFIRLMWFLLEAFYSLSLCSFFDGFLAVRLGEDVLVTGDVDENGRLLVQRLSKGIVEVGAIGYPVPRGAKGVCDQVEGGIADPVADITTPIEVLLVGSFSAVSKIVQDDARRFELLAQGCLSSAPLQQFVCFPSLPSSHFTPPQTMI